MEAQILDLPRLHKAPHQFIQFNLTRQIRVNPRVWPQTVVRPETGQRALMVLLWKNLKTQAMNITTIGQLVKLNRSNYNLPRHQTPKNMRQLCKFFEIFDEKICIFFAVIVNIV